MRCDVRFDGQVVLVTGGGRGIGATMVGRFAEQGATVLVADIDVDSARRVAAGTPRARALGLDVADHQQVREVLAAQQAALGHIDVLVNNAITCSDTPLLELTEAEWRRDVDVALTGAFSTSQAVLPGMIERGAGVIVNISSVNALTYCGNEGYSAAKAGLLSLTRSIAVRYGRAGIRCNAVVPGTIATPAWDHRIETDPGVLEGAASWYPLGRVGTPDDVASAVLFLASTEASWITGVALPVDGGLLAGNPRFAEDIVPPRP
jgi:NAD(P)-dependent dehydrogenase (short-subunit alcohol dehydrogenase family)